MGSRGGSSSGRGRGGKGAAGLSGPGNGPAPAAAAPASRVLRPLVSEAPDAARPAAVARSESPARGAPERPDNEDNDNEGEGANVYLIVSPEEITASRRDGTNAKRRLSGDELIEGFDKNAVGFCIL